MFGVMLQPGIYSRRKVVSAGMKSTAPNSEANREILTFLKGAVLAIVYDIVGASRVRVGTTTPALSFSSSTMFVHVIETHTDIETVDYLCIHLL